MKTLKITFLLTGVLVAGLFSAFGAAQLRLTDGSTTVTVTDGAPDDMDAAPGAITYVGPVGADWTVNVTSGVTKPAVGSAFFPSMQSSSVNVSTKSSTLTILFSDDDFQAPGAVSASVGGTTAGNVSFQIWVDSGNSKFAETTLIDDFGPFGPGPFDGSAVGAVAIATPYSITLKGVITHGEGSQVSSFGFPISIQPTFDGCRVTGGSNHQTNVFQTDCITTELPTHISHGGQVGAAFGVESAWSPNSPCIRGEWQHNRHLKGNSLVGVLHASGNGNEHQFDSLLCACLPCDDDPGAVGVVGGICNPGDRICGPEPRRAPANKICFSGVGDYTFTTGNKTVKAVFRVDIEDRSEGNSHASAEPPDRYRIRIWILDPACGRSADPTTPANMAIRFAASADPAQIANLATTENLKVNIPPDIDDGGDMIQGNHQLHPATSAECTSFAAGLPAQIDASSLVAALSSSGVGAFGIVAQGLQTTQNPSFAYRNTIVNRGSTTLSNLSVLAIADSGTTDATSLYFAPGATLTPGGSVTRSYTNAWGADTVSSIVVTANSADDGTPVVSGSSTIAIVSLAGPTGLTAKVAGTKITLSWSALSGASSYKVKRSTAAAGPYTTIATATKTTYTDAVAKGTTYYYRVSGIKSGAETLNSSAITVKTR
jgi:hypothetical protein